jgi:DNA polymerase-3 subunit epsilon/ATP-dependent DNA helicase DinG
MLEEFIVLDLETTGLDPLNDKIIEVGAVKINRNKIVESYSTFINPEINIPDYIVNLTGITNDDVRDAQVFAESSSDLVEFIGDRPIVGQFIKFDLDFLSESGLIFDNIVLDTRDLALILMPTLNAFSLSSLIKELNVSNASPHKALSDAQATAEVFISLRNLIKGLDIKSKIEISIIAAKNFSHLANFFKDEIEIEQDISIKDSLYNTLIQYEKTFSNSEPTNELINPSLDKKHNMSELFNEFSKDNYDFDYEHRQGQIQLSEMIYSSLYDGGHLLAEAGAGIGKSLSYLLAASMYSLETSDKVIVSTHRNNLQNQLFDKDFKVVTQLINDLYKNNQFKVSVLKGRQNYLCLNNFLQILNENTGFNDNEFKFFSRISVWSNTTIFGDLAEINLNKKERDMWSTINANDSDCLINSRNHHIIGKCFLSKARELAEAANVVIINHSLLMSNIVNDEKVLPAFTSLIIDEAHQLHDIANQQLSKTINLSEIQKLLSKNIIPEILNSRKELFNLKLNSANLKDLEESHKTFQVACENCISFLRKNIKLINNNFDELLNESNHSNSTETEIPIVNNVISSDPWIDTLEIAKDISRHFGKFLLVIDRHMKAIDNDIKKYDKYLSRIGKLKLTIMDALDILDEDILDNDKEYLVSVASATNKIGFIIRPNDISETLEEFLYSSKKSVIALSATLRSYNNAIYDFNFVSKQLGLNQSDSISIKSPYDYENHVCSLAVNDIALPGSQNYEQVLASSIINVAQILEGRSLVLFTSNATLSNVSEIVKASKSLGNIQVFAQGIDGQPYQLIRKFQDNPKSILLGTSSFWEGIDITNNMLQCVIMTRLPFLVPSDPVLLANTMNNHDVFGTYQLPTAILKFRQGFGRLIRGINDKGIFLVLDSRIATKSYGSFFIESIKDTNLEIITNSQLANKVRDWKSNEIDT